MLTTPDMDYLPNETIQITCKRGKEFNTFFLIEAKGKLQIKLPLSMLSSQVREWSRSYIHSSVGSKWR
jgi:hypothetical protein